MTDAQLVAAAQKAREMSHSPYSHFRVGAALLCKDGKVYLGSNIENAAYPVSICAERVALFKAVSEGERGFEAIAVVGGREGKTSPLCPPCGVCRQALAEFCPQTFKILLGDPQTFKAYTLAQLLPLGFTSEDL